MMGSQLEKQPKKYLYLYFLKSIINNMGNTKSVQHSFYFSNPIVLYKEFRVTDSIITISKLPYSNVVVVGSDVCYVFDLHSGKTIFELKDSEILSKKSNNIITYVSTLTITNQFSLEEKLDNSNSTILSKSLLKDNVIIIYCIQNHLKLWNYATGEYLSTKIEEKSIIQSIMPLEGTVVVLSFINSNQLELIDLINGEKMGTINTGHRGTINKMIRNDKKIFTGGEDGTIKSWTLSQIDDGVFECIKTIRAHSGGVSALCMLKNGGCFLSSGNRDNIMKLWDTESHQLIESIKTPHKSIGDIVLIRPSIIATIGKFEKVIHIWNSINWDLLTTLQTIKEERISCLSAMDPFSFLAGTTNGNLLMWRIMPTVGDEIFEHVKEKTFLDIEFVFLTHRKTILDYVNDDYIDKKLQSESSPLIKRHQKNHEFSINSLRSSQSRKESSVTCECCNIL